MTKDDLVIQTGCGTRGKLIAQWYVSLDEESDWLGMVLEITPKKLYAFEYRFHYFGEGDDTRNWYSVKDTAPAAEVVAKARKFIKELFPMLTARELDPDLFVQTIAVSR